MLTLKELQAFPDGEVFATGVLPNNHIGIFLTNTREGDGLRWVAKKGWGYTDWAIYAHWDDEHDTAWIADHGDKVTTDHNIQRCVPCEDDVLKLYRK